MGNLAEYLLSKDGQHSHSMGHSKSTCIRKMFVLIVCKTNNINSFIHVSLFILYDNYYYNLKHMKFH